MLRHLVLAVLLAPPVFAQPAPTGQGWTRSEAEIVWNSPVGSRLVPFDWFAALEAPGGAPFADPARLQLYGLRPAAPGPANPGTLPTGLSRERDRTDGLWLGLTCAACHGRTLSFRGADLPAEGAGSLFDAAGFLADLSAALSHTEADDDAFARFADRLGAPDADRSALRTRLRGVSARQAALATADAAAMPGPGRFDLLGAAVHAVQPGAVQTPAAPVRPPRLWGTAAPLSAFVTEALATGATADPALLTTVSVFDLVKLSALFRKLEPPPWPADLPAIEPARAETGRAVFAANCAGCHVTPRGTPPLLVAAGQLGTDPAALQFRPGAATVAAVSTAIAARIPRQPAPAPQAPRPAAFPAPPLAGIWAAAPFLHNGSVPNLRQLLTPPEARTRVFSLAPADFDPADIGLPTDPAVPPLFDTARPGNANTGHTYGTTLPDELKDALLEYLKTL